MNLTALLMLPPFAYLMGSVPFGLLFARRFTGKDVRRQGSGNIGAANVRRVAGTRIALAVLAADLLKGAFPVTLAVWICGRQGPRAETYLCLVALAAFLGHLYPLYMKFKNGGKGVATAAGCFLVLAPVACLVALFVYVMLICWVNRASVGSLGAAAVLPVAVGQATDSSILTGCALLTAIFIFIRHRENLGRLLSGTEPSMWEKKGGP